MAKNTICLWYDKDAEDAARFYAESENGSGVGVQLKFNSSSTRRLAILEAEGGIVTGRHS